MSDAEDDYFGTAWGDPERFQHPERDYGWDDLIDNEFGTGGDDNHMPMLPVPTSGKASCWDALADAGMVPRLVEQGESRPSAAAPGTFFVAGGSLPARAFFLDPEALRRIGGQFSVPHTNPTKGKSTMDVSNLAAARRELEEMLARVVGMVAVVERFGGEPADGTVIKFEHEFDTVGRSGEIVYTYVAIRKAGSWHVSGRPFGARAAKWAELLDFIGEGRAWIAREFEEVPVPGAASASVDDDDARSAVASVLARSAVASVLARRAGDDIGDVAAEVVALLNERA